MVKILLSIVGITVVLLVGFFFLFSVVHKSVLTTGTSTITLPIASSTTSSVTNTTTTSGTSSTTMTVAARGGGTPIVTKSFIANGVTSPDVENPGTYYLAGSPGYCLKDGTCPSGAPESNFIVTYDAPNQFFTIALTKEPLGAARIAAEQFLMSTLGVSQTQLCSINYYIGTVNAVNAIYAGKNLGFSFCPGATVLPE